MKKPLSVCVLSVVLAACGGSDGAELAGDGFCAQALSAVAAFMGEARQTHPVPDDRRYGGTLVVGNYGELGDGLMSATTSENTSRQHQQFVGLMTLIDYDENYEPRPYLAERFELAEDSTSITFYLRQDVRWHDGERTDAHDVAFTWEAINDLETGYPNISDLEFYKKGPGSYEVIDDFTIRLYMDPHPQFIDPFRPLGILPEHLLGDVPRAELRRHPYGTQCPVGNGPFVFESHRPQDRWTFTANPVFPEGLGGRPFVDRYIYRVVTEQTTLLTELLTENVDVYIAPAPEQVPTILDNPNMRLENYESRQYTFVGWNARVPKLSDPRVRRALTMGTNREEIVAAVVRGYGEVSNSGVPPHHWAHDPSAIPTIPYDPEGAAALLEAAGWRDRDGDGVRESADGTPLEISIKYNPNTVRQQIAEIMQSQLSQIGVDVEPRVVEWTTLVDQISNDDNRDFEGVVMGWVTDFNLDDTDLFHSDNFHGQLAMSGTQNPEIDRYLEELRLIADRDLARERWAEYQRVVIEEQPYTYVYFPERLAGVNNRVQGVVMDARGDYATLKDWYIDPASR